MAAQRISPADEKRVKAEGFLRNKGTDNFNGRVITVKAAGTAFDFGLLLVETLCGAETTQKVKAAVVYR